MQPQQMNQSKLIDNLGDLAEFFNANYLGDPKTTFNHVSPIGSCKAGSIVAIFSSKYARYLNCNSASIVIIDDTLKEKCQQNALIVANPRMVFAKITQWFYPQTLPSPGIHPTAILGQNCSIDSKAYVGPYTVLGDGVSIGKGAQIHGNVWLGDEVTVGDRSCLHTGVKCFAKTVIGKDCSVSANTVIGADGFGFVFDEAKTSWFKVPQVGFVCIEDDVEIGSNSSIDKAAFGETRIGQGTKIGSQVMIGHNVKIGKHCIMACRSGIGGSSVLGDYCILGGASLIKDNISVASHVTLTAVAFVTRSIKKSGEVFSSGIPAQKHSNWLRILAKLFHQKSGVSKNEH